MNTVSALLDASAAGSLANAALCGPGRQNPAEAGGDFEQDPSPPASSPCPTACRSKWGRLVDAVLSPISGPPSPPRNDANNI